ncbi:MAG: hypothetical protein KKE61_01110, partial [Proteobacteria bacterium]|nr:hypothetical protein [Pseudomonadota bacterium]
MDITNFENIILDKKTLLFPPDIEKKFFLQGLAARLSFLKAGIFLLCCLNVLLQYYNFNKLILIPSLLMFPLPGMLLILKNKRFEKHLDFFCCAALFFICTAVISIIVHSPNEFYNFPMLIFLVISGFI